jgi:hypothetical protein
LAASRQTQRTRREALLEFLGLVEVLQDEGVEVSMAPDLELDVLALLVLLDTRRCWVCQLRVGRIVLRLQDCVAIVGRDWVSHSQEASFRRHISMNCLISDTSCGIVAVGESSTEMW